MNWVPYAFFGPIVLMMVFDPLTMIPAMIGFVVVYGVLLYLFEKLVGKKPSHGEDLKPDD